MYCKTGKLDKQEYHAMSVIKCRLDDEVSLRLVQYLDCEGLIVLNRTLDDSSLTEKGLEVFDGYEEVSNE